MTTSPVAAPRPALTSAVCRALAVLWALVASLVAPGWALAQADGLQPGATLHGQVRDTSGAAMPGVTVTATADGHAEPHVAVTDGTGTYALEGLPPGRWRVRFDLQGFETVTFDTVVLQVDRQNRLDCQMRVAPVTEDVTVYGLAPRDPSPPPQRPRAPEPLPLPEHDAASVCGPGLAPARPAPLARIRAHRHDAHRHLMIPGDEFVLDAGTDQGLHVGQNLVVRRTYRVERAGGTDQALTGEHTSGVIQVVMADPVAAFAVVVYACDEFVRGDYVEPFTPEPRRPPGPLGVPDYQRAARVLFGDEGQLLGAPRRALVIDRGRRDGLSPGQRVTFFRRSDRDRRAMVVVGEGIVVAAKDTSATVRVETATDAIYFGDGVAPHRPDRRGEGVITAVSGGRPEVRAPR